QRRARGPGRSVDRAGARRRAGGSSRRACDLRPSRRGMTARVALVLVSHSVQLAAGVAELAEQMAPDVLIRGVGGGPDGGLGTSLDDVQRVLAEVLAELPSDGSVVVLGDLGSS